MTMIGSQVDDDILDIVEDDEYPSESATPARAWRVLVVDDDEEVHRATTFSLSGIEILDHALSLSHAYSAAEATALLRKDPDFAVILLDVVMETDDAGLRLVRLIREELRLATVRIILRTGQPGYAPELSVIRDFDINDYRTKSELTRARLLTSLYSSLRAYSHIQALENSRRGLEQIIEASAELFRPHSLTAFCEGVLIQLGGLLDIEANGIVLARIRKSVDPATPDPAEGGPVVLAAAGPFQNLSGCPLSVIPDQPLKALLLRTLEQRASIFEPNATILHIVGPSGDDLAVYLSTRRLMDPMDRKLLEVFSSNIALGFDNASLIDHIRTLAFLDPLTRLPNRTRFQIEIANRLEAMRRRGGNERLMVMLLDLDHFQTVNDGLGAKAGDGLLMEVGRRFQLILGEPGAVSRLGSDMFGVLAELNGPDEDQRVLEAIMGCFGTPFAVEGSEISVKTSGGYVVTDREETDVFRLLRHAGMALKRCKKAGRGHIVRFETVMEAELRQRLVLVSHIAEAQATGQFFLVYQPQLRLSDNAVVGVEALLRWRRPDGTFIQPDAFIPAAEDAGHMVALGEWVLRQACLRQVQWRTRGIARLRVAVNVSVRQLRDGDEFVRTALRTAQDTQADPSDIELEITESDGMEDERILPIIQQLRDIGFRIAIDDFGTGYSSLARLQQLPASLLKIDRSFVQDIDSRSENRSIASMIVKMGHELGFSTIAEGVETVAQEAVLRDLGCDAVQGFLYARPMPPDELETWLEGRAVA